MKTSAKLLLLPLFGGLMWAGCGSKGDSGADSGTTGAPRVSTAAATEPVKSESSIPKGWKLLSSDKGGFEILMPVKTKTEAVPIPTELGTMRGEMNSGAVKDDAYVTMLIEYPSLVEKRDPQKMLDGGRNGMVGKEGRKLISEKQIEIAGYPGRELVVMQEAEHQGKKLTLRTDARIYLVKNRLYQVVAVSPSGKPSAMAKDFLDSFKLTEVAKK